MKLVLALGVVVTLIGCTTPAPPLYGRNSFTQLPWAKKSFDEAKAKCRNDSMRYEGRLKEYKIHRAPYKACMEKYGYHYNGNSELDGNDNEVIYHSPFEMMTNTASPAVSGINQDKAALYR